MQYRPPWRVNPAIGWPLTVTSYVIPSRASGAADAGREKTEIAAWFLVKKSWAAWCEPTLRTAPPWNVQPSRVRSATNVARPVTFDKLGAAARDFTVSDVVAPPF